MKYLSKQESLDDDLSGCHFNMDQRFFQIKMLNETVSHF